MTQGHNSCQLVAPLGTQRNRGNLFSLARLSSHTETVFVLFDCIAPLGFFLFFNLPFSFFLFVSLPRFSQLLPPLLLFFDFSWNFLIALSSFSSLPVPLFHHPLSHSDKGERYCFAVCLPAWLQGLLSVNEVIRRHSDLTKGICSACCIFLMLFFL